MSNYYYPNNEILSKEGWNPLAPASKKGWWIAAALALVFLVAGIFGWRYWVDMKIQHSTVLVIVPGANEDKGRTGSGVFISPKGYVLTNRHVILNENGTRPSRIEVHYLSGTSERQIREATVEKIGEGAEDAAKLYSDWCVLKVAPGPDVPYVELLDKEDFQQEESLKAYGFPCGNLTATNAYGPGVKVEPGVITRVDRSNQGGVVRLTHSAATASGMSGGPVIQNGRLVGLNTAVLKAPAAGNPNENWALPCYLLKEPVFKIYGPK